ncbi:MAG: hypothetical protein M0R80_02090 [Proteobacteria bacterium]|jgi:hypothetical protein|nr:hypothetical protein [Pseudomonadota bacterium]
MAKMQFKQWLLHERYGQYNTNNTIIVDVQPMYAQHMNFGIKNFAEFLKQTLKNRKVIYFFNGDSIGSNDNKEEISNWLAESARENTPYPEDDDEEIYWQDHEDTYSLFHNRCLWYDKGYGFFRSWMDHGVSDATIIKTIRYMIMKRINDSRDLGEEELQLITNGEDIPLHDPLFIPSIPLNILKQFSGAFLCGGGKNECLKEVTLLMNALNIKYTILSEFTY